MVPKSKTKPRDERAERDFKVTDTTDTVSAQNPPLPKGASTVLDVNEAPLTGHYHSLPKDTQLPKGLGVVADGKDVIPSSPHGKGHHTVYPTTDMTVDEFNELF